jgi:hypothetical protein
MNGRISVATLKPFAWGKSTPWFSKLVLLVSTTASRMEQSQALLVQQENNMGPNSNHGRKLFGREFYQSIGSPKYIMAPMVDRSEFVSIPSYSHLNA